MLSLFSGVAGLDLAAIEAGIETVAFCEIEPYPTKVLQKRFPGVKIYDDVRNITRTRLEEDGIFPIDIVCGGFPCQDLSVTGNQKGLTNEDGSQTRSGLWFEMFRIIQEVRPTWVVAENVRGAVNIALDTVTDNLTSEGYEVRSIVIPACAVGAPHQRERLFVVAHCAG
jgi:DNA (cytosine-5)-methyltransferase 1